MRKTPRTTDGASPAAGQSKGHAVRATASACCIATAALCLVSIAVVLWKYPLLGWDALPYVAIAHGWIDPAGTDAHDAAYADIARFGDAHHLEHVLANLMRGPYRVEMSDNAEAFREQLPFYRIRPLYVFLVSVVARFTPTVTAAGMLVSSLAFCTTAFALLVHGARVTGAREGSIAAVLFALSAPAIQAGRLMTPDALLMAWVTIAVVALARKRDLLGASLLAAGTLIRTDLAVFNVCLAAALMVFARRRPNIPAVSAVLAGSVLISLAVSRVLGGYGYFTLYRFTFVNGNVPHPSLLSEQPIPLREFVKHTAIGIGYGIENAGLWMILAALGLAWVVLGRTAASPRAALCRALTAAVAAQTCIRFIIFPELDLRLDAPPLAILAVTLLTMGGRDEGVPARTEVSSTTA